MAGTGRMRESVVGERHVGSRVRDKNSGFYSEKGERPSDCLSRVGVLTPRNSEEVEKKEGRSGFIIQSFCAGHAEPPHAPERPLWFHFQQSLPSSQLHCLIPKGGTGFNFREKYLEMGEGW